MELNRALPVVLLDLPVVLLDLPVVLLALPVVLALPAVLALCEPTPLNLAEPLVRVED